MVEDREVFGLRGNKEPEHSPKGASSAERWMNCPGSAVILKQLALPDSDEPEYRGLGIAAHEAAAKCMIEGIDAWEIEGQEFHGFPCDQNMVESVQMYLDYCRSLMGDGVTVSIEEKIGGNDPEKRPHPDFYGRLDFSAYGRDFLDIVDYKHGEGIAVEAFDNPQLKYYAYGKLWDRIHNHAVNVRSDRVVRLHIVQPRAYHNDGPIRVFETTAGEIIHWAENELLPAMERAEFETDFQAGKWCRFCPAKLFCPLLQGVYGAAAKADSTMIANFGQKRMAMEYSMLPAVKFYMKALEEECFRRANNGNTVPGTKLVPKQSRRTWRSGAEEEAKKLFGAAAMEPPSIKSPAELEKLGPKAKEFVKGAAFMPQTDLTIVPLDDKRSEVKVEKARDIFAHFIEAGDKEAEDQEITNG